MRSASGAWPDMMHGQRPLLQTARLPARQRGIALVLVLWLTILLTVIGSGFAFSMRGEALSARNALSLAQARAAADGAVERTVFELNRPRLRPTDAWAPDGQAHTWRDGDIVLTVSAVDESAKIDLNFAPDVLLRGLFANVGGADTEQTARLVEAVADWRDRDDLRRPNGAEEPEYRAAGLKYGPSNSRFETVTELARVLGITTALYARVAGSLTVHARQGGINPATASRDVLLALPYATPDSVDAYLTQRAAAIAAKLPIPPFPPASGLAVGANPTWRIRARAEAPDGVTFVREAVLRPSGDPRRPLIALAWLDETSAPLPAPPADGEPGAVGDKSGAKSEPNVRP